MASLNVEKNMGLELRGAVMGTFIVVSITRMKEPFSSKRGKMEKPHQPNSKKITTSRIISHWGEKGPMREKVTGAG